VAEGPPTFPLEAVRRAVAIGDPRFPVKRLVVDFERALMSVVFADGQIRVEPSQRPVQPGVLGLIRTEYDLASRELHLTLPSRRRITLEVGLPGVEDRPARGRKVVYLDQNHWRTLRDALHAPDALTPVKRDAAMTVCDLARSKRVILPLSSAHAYETGRTYGTLRRELATTMLELSRGWQMRNPLRVRQEELAAALAGREPVARAVFTLDPDVMFGKPSSQSTAPADFSEPMRVLHQRLTNISAIAAAMIEDEPEDPAEARQLAAQWADSHEAIARRLGEDGASAREVRRATFMALVADLSDEIAEAALTSGQAPESLERWIDGDAQGDFARMPYLGQLHDVLFRRVRNVGENWRGNDLTDAHFLSCAAGYADVVVGEKLHADYLAAGNADHGAYVCRTLAQAVNHLAA